MKTYDITIKASITKTLTIEADTEEDAIEIAHEDFEKVNNSKLAHYNQETIISKEHK